MNNMKKLGIDYGDRYIGLAVGTDDIVAPLKVLENRPNHKLERDVLSSISKIILDEKIALVVVGLPFINGKETESFAQIRAFAHKLKKIIPSNVKVVFVDEYYSSKIAKTKSIEFGIPKKKRSYDHAIAACEILKRVHDCHS